MCFHVHLNEAKGSQPTPAEACSTWRENERGEESESRRVLRHVTHAKIDFNKATTHYYSSSILQYRTNTDDAQYAKSAWLAY